MPEPQGSLTAAQHEIMTLIWDAPAHGLGVTEIWQAIGTSRPITRTTILNLVDRLEKRGWLNRQSDGNSYRYTAAAPREWAESRLAAGFLQEYFGGSATQMVQSLLGARELSPQDIDRLRKLLDDAKANRPAKGGRP